MNAEEAKELVPCSRPQNVPAHGSDFLKSEGPIFLPFHFSAFYLRLICASDGAFCNNRMHN